MKKPPPTPNRKDGRFSGYVFLGYKPDHTEKRRYAYGKTIKERDDKLLDIKIQQATGQLVGERIRLVDWQKKWIKNKSGKSEATNTMYKSILDRHIVPVMGQLYLPDIKPFHVQDLVNGLSDRPRTARIAVMTLNQMFEWAIENELMIKNPAKKISLNLPSDRAPEKRRTTAIEETAIRAAALTATERMFVYLCRYVGLRRSEARGGSCRKISPTAN